MYEISFLFYLIVSLFIVRTKNPLLIFLFLAYTLQFWALFFDSYEVVFWMQDKYTFSKFDPLNIYILKVFAVTNFGFLISLFFNKKKSSINLNYSFKISPSNKIPNFLNLLFVVILSVLVFLKVTVHRFDLIFNGFDLVITSLLSICLLSSIIKKCTYQIIIITTLLLIYIFSQVLTADRNFIGVLISGVIFYATFYKINLYKFMLGTLIIIAILFFGVYIAINRAGADLTYTVFLKYLYYNSWTAVLRPVIDMLADENLSIVYLYGKSYLDLVLSFAPSFFYGLFGTVKPYVADNPAQWYVVPGGGGMHAVGVALKNFGLVGVFFQSFLFSYFTIKLVDITKSKNNLLYYAFFMCITITYMKSLWYSMLDFTNMITFFFIIASCIKVLLVILPLKKKG